MVIEETKMSSGVIVRIHDDYIENSVQIEKRLTNLGRIMTNSYKRRVASNNCVSCGSKKNPCSK